MRESEWVSELERERVVVVVSWCFTPSQPKRDRQTETETNR